MRLIYLRSFSLTAVELLPVVVEPKRLQPHANAPKEPHDVTALEITWELLLNALLHSNVNFLPKIGLQVDFIHLAVRKEVAACDQFALSEEELGRLYRLVC